MKELIKKIIKEVINEERCNVNGCDRLRSSSTPTVAPCISEHPHRHDEWNGYKCDACGVARIKPIEKIKNDQTT